MKIFFYDQGNKICWVVAALVSRLERRNKQYFNLDLIKKEIHSILKIKLKLNNNILFYFSIYLASIIDSMLYARSSINLL
jgi:hypothetical protein